MEVRQSHPHSFAEYPLSCTPVPVALGQGTLFPGHCTDKTAVEVARQSHLPPQFLAGTDDAHPIHARVLFCAPCIRVTLDYIPTTLMGNDDDHVTLSRLEVAGRVGGGQPEPFRVHSGDGSRVPAWTRRYVPVYAPRPIWALVGLLKSYVRKQLLGHMRRCAHTHVHCFNRIPTFIRNFPN